MEDTAEWLGIGERSIRTYIERHNTTGTILSAEEIRKAANPKYKRPHRRHKIDMLCGVYIKTYIDEFPQCTLADLQRYCAQNGYTLSEAAIHNYTVDVSLSFKVISGVKCTLSDPASFSLHPSPLSVNDDASTHSPTSNKWNLNGGPGRTANRKTRAMCPLPRRYLPLSVPLSSIMLRLPLGTFRNSALWESV